MTPDILVTPEKHVKEKDFWLASFLDCTACLHHGPWRWKMGPTYLHPLIRWADTKYPERPDKMQGIYGGVARNGIWLLKDEERLKEILISTKDIMPSRRVMVDILETYFYESRGEALLLIDAYGNKINDRFENLIDHYDYLIRIPKFVAGVFDSGAGNLFFNEKKGRYSTIFYSQNRALIYALHEVFLGSPSDMKSKGKQFYRLELGQEDTNIFMEFVRDDIVLKTDDAIFAGLQGK